MKITVHEMISGYRTTVGWSVAVDDRNVATFKTESEAREYAAKIST